MLTRHLAVRILIGLIALFALIQLVPYGRGHRNPAVSRSPRWDSPRTARLVAGACNDCHSNLTKWKWYSNVAPASWLVQNDVDGGRDNLNFSRWDKPQPALDELVRQVADGGMPPLQYKIIHSDARLSSAEKQALIAGLKATYSADPPPVRAGGD